MGFEKIIKAANANVAAEIVEGLIRRFGYDDIIGGVKGQRGANLRAAIQDPAVARRIEQAAASGDKALIDLATTLSDPTRARMVTAGEVPLPLDQRVQAKLAADPADPAKHGWTEDFARTLDLLPDELRAAVEANDPVARARAYQYLQDAGGADKLRRQRAAEAGVPMEPPLQGRVQRVLEEARARDPLDRVATEAPPTQYDPTGQGFVVGPNAAFRQQARVRPSQAGIGTGSMDTSQAAQALLAPPAPRDLGTSFVDTGALGPGAQQLFGVPGEAFAGQVGTHGAGRVLPGVTGPAGSPAVQIAAPGGRRMDVVDVMPGGRVAGEMPVGRGGDVVGPGATDVQVATRGNAAGNELFLDRRGVAEPNAWGSMDRLDYPGADGHISFEEAADLIRRGHSLPEATPGWINDQWPAKSDREFFADRGIVTDPELVRTIDRAEAGFEGRINRRGSEVTSEDIVTRPMESPAAAPAVDPVPVVDPVAPQWRPSDGLRNPDVAGTRAPAAASAPVEPLAAADVTKLQQAQRSARMKALATAAAAGAGAFGLHHALKPIPELDEPPMDVASPDELVNNAVAQAVDDLAVEDDLSVPEVTLDPIAIPDRPAWPERGMPDQVALPPADELLAEVANAPAAAPIEPMVGEPVGIARSEVPAYRRLMEIRDLLQRGGDEEQIRNNPRYADLDDYQRERAILRGRGLGDRRQRVRMAGILSQGGRLPWGQAAAAGDRFLRMEPQEQQDFLAAGGFNPGATRAMDQMARERQAHRRALEVLDRQGANRVREAEVQGGFQVQGQQIAADAQMGVAERQAGVAERGQNFNREQADADRVVEIRRLDDAIRRANFAAEQATAEGNANRAAQAKESAARLQVERDKIAASDRQSTAQNQSREKVAGMANPGLQDPLEAVQNRARAEGGQAMTAIIGREKARGRTRDQVRAAIARDPVASQAPVADREALLQQHFPR